MSVAAVNWAYLQDTDRSTSKFLLVTLANLVRHDDDRWEIYASVEYLTRATCLNRKTVLDGLRRLREAGLILDTGRMAGINRCSPIYRLVAKVQSAVTNKIPPDPPISAGPEQKQLAVNACGNAGTPAMRLSRTWALPAAWRSWTRTQKPTWSDARIDSVAAIFHAHWTSITSKLAEKEDWFAAWRIWVLKERNSTPGAAEADDGEPDYVALGAQLRAAVDAMHKEESAEHQAVTQGSEKTGQAQNRVNPYFSTAGTESGPTTGTESGPTAGTESGPQ